MCSQAWLCIFSLNLDFYCLPTKNLNTIAQALTAAAYQQEIKPKKVEILTILSEDAQHINLTQFFSKTQYTYKFVHHITTVFSPIEYESYYI